MTSIKLIMNVMYTIILLLLLPFTSQSTTTTTTISSPYTNIKRRNKQDNKILTLTLTNNNKKTNELSIEEVINQIQKRSQSKCRDASSYKNPLTNLSCSSHAQTVCKNWMFVGLSYEEVLDLLISCPFSCGLCSSSLNADLVDRESSSSTVSLSTSVDKKEYLPLRMENSTFTISNNAIPSSSSSTTEPTLSTSLYSNEQTMVELQDSFFFYSHEFNSSVITSEELKKGLVAEEVIDDNTITSMNDTNTTYASLFHFSNDTSNISFIPMNNDSTAISQNHSFPFANTSNLTNDHYKNNSFIHSPVKENEDVVISLYTIGSDNSSIASNRNQSLYTNFTAVLPSNSMNDSYSYNNLTFPLLFNSSIDDNDDVLLLFTSTSTINLSSSELVIAENITMPSFISLVEDPPVFFSNLTNTSMKLSSPIYFNESSSSSIHNSTNTSKVDLVFSNWTNNGIDNNDNGDSLFTNSSSLPFTYNPLVVADNIYTNTNTSITIPQLSETSSSEPTEPPSSIILSNKPSNPKSNPPSEIPSSIPSTTPSYFPSISPTTNSPSNAPSLVLSTTEPSDLPKLSPTDIPSTNAPTYTPSTIPSSTPSYPSNAPSLVPSSTEPSDLPTLSPTDIPSTNAPTYTPSITPSTIPSIQPTKAFTTTATIDNLSIIFLTPNEMNQQTITNWEQITNSFFEDYYQQNSNSNGEDNYASTIKNFKVETKFENQFLVTSMTTDDGTRRRRLTSTYIPELIIVYSQYISYQQILHDPNNKNITSFLSSKEVIRNVLSSSTNRYNYLSFLQEQEQQQQTPNDGSISSSSLTYFLSVIGVSDISFDKTPPILPFVKTASSFDEYSNKGRITIWIASIAFGLFTTIFLIIRCFFMQHEISDGADKRNVLNNIVFTYDTPEAKLKHASLQQHKKNISSVPSLVLVHSPFLEESEHHHTSETMAPSQTLEDGLDNSICTFLDICIPKGYLGIAIEPSPDTNDFPIVVDIPIKSKNNTKSSEQVYNNQQQLQIGDRIIAINGTNIKGKPILKISKLLRKCEKSKERILKVLRRKSVSTSVFACPATNPVVGQIHETTTTTMMISSHHSKTSLNANDVPATSSPQEQPQQRPSYANNIECNNTETNENIIITNSYKPKGSKGKTFSFSDYSSVATEHQYAAFSCTPAQHGYKQNPEIPPTNSNNDTTEAETLELVNNNAKKTEAKVVEAPIVPTNAMSSKMHFFQDDIVDCRRMPQKHTNTSFNTNVMSVIHNTINTSPPTPKSPQVPDQYEWRKLEVLVPPGTISIGLSNESGIPAAKVMSVPSTSTFSNGNQNTKVKIGDFIKAIDGLDVMEMELDDIGRLLDVRRRFRRRLTVIRKQRVTKGKDGK